MARVLHRVDVAELAPGHRLIMQVRQYILPLWPFWRLPMDGVCIQILPIPHNFHDLCPFDRKPCIAGGNFGGMDIHLYNFCSSAREAYPSTASPPKPNPTRRRSPSHLIAMPLQSSPRTSPYSASTALSAAWFSHSATIQLLFHMNTDISRLRSAVHVQKSKSQR